MTMSRQPHAPLNLETRRQKGLKIERLLKLDGRRQPIQMLEVGTGSGGIAHYFGTTEHLQCKVSSVDVNDVRVITDGYAFQQISGIDLPFTDASFDVVISNHVIEHVGNEPEQHQHLAELHRVLRDDGIAYLAVPNRWMLIEPHYRLIFLSWLPHTLRSRYLRLMNKGNFYDCEPLEMWQLENFLLQAGFSGCNVSVEAMRETISIEMPDSLLGACINRTPDWVFHLLRPIIPTLIYTMLKK